ncbi:MAG: hypothetical protein AAF602_16375 [Myxococcota bacterium]
MVAVLWALVAHATCPDAPAREVVAGSREVLQSFDAADSDQLDRARMRLQRALPCLDAPLDGPALRALHRAMALVAYVDRDREASSRAWAALARLDPAARPDARRFPDGHGVWATFEAARNRSPNEAALPSRRRVHWTVEGVRSATAPTERAFVLGAVVAGELVRSTYIYRIDEVGELAVEAPPRRGRAERVVTTSLAGGLVVAGAGLLGSAASLEQRLLRGEVPPDEIEPRQAMANRRYAAGGVLVGAGAVLATVGFSIRW